MTRCPACGATLVDPQARFCARCAAPIGAPLAEGLLPGAAGGEHVLFEGSPAALPTLGAWVLAVLTLGVYGLVAWARARATTIRVTSQRIVVEKGLFSKTLDQIDLYRVVDYRVERPLGQRLVGTGNLVLETLDKTTRELALRGLRTDVVALYERLRTATEAERARRRVRLMDVEQP